MSAPDGSIGTVGIQRPGGGRPDSHAGWRAGHVGLGQQALRPSVRAAVYVQPGAKVAVHLEKPLAIDFDPEGRKGRSPHRGNHALSGRKLGPWPGAGQPSQRSPAAPPAGKLLTHGDRDDGHPGSRRPVTAAVARPDGTPAVKLLDARQSLRRPLTDTDVQAAPAEQMRYTRTARNEVIASSSACPTPTS